MKFRILFFLLSVSIISVAQDLTDTNIFDKNKKTGIIIINEGISTYIINSDGSYGMFGILGGLISKGGGGYESTEGKRFSEALKVVENRLNIKNLFLQTYKTIYEKKGIDIVKIKGKLTLEYLDSFKKPRRTKKKYSRYDFRFIKEKYKVEQLIVVDVKYGLLLNSNNGVCEIFTRVIDLEDNSLIYKNSSLGNIDVEGKWKTPPEYESLYNAIRKAIENAILLEKIKFR